MNGAVARTAENEMVTEAKLRLLEARLTGGRSSLGGAEAVQVQVPPSGTGTVQGTMQAGQSSCPAPISTHSLHEHPDNNSLLSPGGGISGLLPPAEVDNSLDSEISDEEDEGGSQGGGRIAGSPAWGIQAAAPHASKRLRVRPIAHDGDGNTVEGEFSRSESLGGRAPEGTGGVSVPTSGRKRKARGGARDCDGRTSSPGQLADATNRQLPRASSGGRRDSLGGGVGSVKGQKTINRYFLTLGDSSSRDSQSLGTGGCTGEGAATTSDHAIGLSPCVLRAEAPCQTEGPSLVKLEAERTQLLRETTHLRQENKGLSSRVAEAERGASAAHAEADALRAELEELNAQATAREKQVAGAIQKLVAQGNEWQRRALDAQLRQDSVRLGNVGVERAGAILTEVWIDGPAFLDISRRCDALVEAREQIDALRKSLKKQLPLPDGSARTGAKNGSDSDNTALTISPQEYVAREEVLKAKLLALKREEDGLHREKERLESQRVKHIREAKRRKDEDDSRFNSQHVVLNGRYALMDMLGKGGFSEVYRAFDTKALCEVAIKIHQLNSQWNEAKKQSYVRHAVREYNIHKSLKHRRVVALTDIFEIDNNTFATVLELCRGGDLEGHLREHSTLPEKEAKAIVVQILHGLAYLNDPERRIIHYDLKPANILFDGFGEVKITDFGLSKIVEDGQTQGMELTSQGAGTYWYLPPECFEMTGRPPIISSKVDVWSVGIIFYQMLYGKRPFGHSMSQENILREKTIINAKQVDFPSKPSVSSEAKDFIKRCLTYRQAGRPDVHEAVADAYLTPGR